MGEVVTENIKTIGKIPHSISFNVPKIVELRGEIFFNLDDFDSINRSIEKDGGKVFINPRNAAAGTLRNLDIEVVKQRPLNIFLYALGGCSDDLKIESHQDFLTFLKKNNLPNNDLITFGDAITASTAVKKILDSREALNYEIDGAVVKVNDFNLQEKLGFVSKAPRWAVAWKFPASEKFSKVNDILFSVGRTGIVGKKISTTVEQAINHGMIVLGTSNISEGCMFHESNNLIKQNNKFVGHNFEGKYLDCGTMHGYIKSSLEIAKS